MWHRLQSLAIVFSIVVVTSSGCSGTRRTAGDPIGVTACQPVIAQNRQPSNSESPDNGFSTVKLAVDDFSEDAGAITLTAADNADDPESPPDEPSSPPIPDLYADFGSGAAAWTLESLEATALQNNPAIAQASASAYKAMGFREQVGLLPNPTVGYNGTQLADQGTDQHVAFVEQDIVTARKLNRNRTVLSQEVQSQLWQVETQRFRVQTDVRQRFYTALAAQRRLELATAFREIAKKGVDIAQDRVDAGEGAVPDVLQAEILLNQVEIQMRQADAEFRGAWNQLLAVVGLPVGNPGRLDGILPDRVAINDTESVTREALTASPELQAARARVARARANVNRQEVQPIPNFAFLLAAGVDNGTNSGMINAQLGLPLPIYNRNQGNISAAHAELTRACQDLRRIELSIESRMAGAVKEYESAAAAVNKYRDSILPKAERTLKLGQEAYEAGEYGFLQILVARKTYFESNLEFVLAQADLARAEAYLRGLALSGGLDDTPDTTMDAGLRDQALSGQ